MARLKLGSIGKLLPTLEARIIDAEGNDAAEYEAGEMVLRGPTIMRYVSSGNLLVSITDSAFLLCSIVDTGEANRRPKIRSRWMVGIVQEMWRRSTKKAIGSKHDELCLAGRPEA